MTDKAVIISGPTASGKSTIAQEISENYQKFCIINADSMQIYKELPILTAQPIDCIARFKKDYYLYGILNYTHNFSVVTWVDFTKIAMKKIWLLGKIPLIVGGTGLYIKSLIHGLSNIPEISLEIKTLVSNLFVEIGVEKFYKLLCTVDHLSATKIHSNDKYRMIRAMEVFNQTGKPILTFYNNKKQTANFDFLHITIQPTRKLLYDSCNQRFTEMIKANVLEEVLNFRIKTGSSTSILARALGYNYLCKYLSNEISKEKSIELSQIQTRQYAKRQVTWFKNQAPESISIQFESHYDARKQTLSVVDNYIN